tara:strand:+ start:693 stop:2318 length:1626 start_codon:yes stop_codon:yes gene_type:complete
MINNLKQAVSDVLYVSKITSTKKKKLIIILSVVLSQIIAFADISIILLFTKLFSELPVLPEAFSIFEPFFEVKLLLPIMIVARYYLQYLQSVTLKKLEFSVQANLKIYMLNNIFDNKNFSTADTLYYMSTLSNHISFFYTSIATFLNFTLQTFAFTSFLFMTEPSTISAFLVGILFLTYPIYLIIVKSRQYEHFIYDKGREASRDIQRVIENSFLIKLLKKEKDEITRYSQITLKLYHDLVIKHKLGVLNSYLPPFVTVFIISIIAIFFDDYFTITLAFMGVTLRMFQSLASMSNSVNQIVNSQVHLETFYEMELFKSSSLKENYILDTNLSSSLAIETFDLEFKYLNSEELIFKNINLQIEKNSHTVFTGVNGSGKSTLLGLLAGVYFPTSGKVLSTSSNSGFVGPNPLIFSGSLKENLIYGNKNNLNDREILDVANKFNLFGKDSNLDLDKKINNKNLSSGQMQKIAFIRVILSKVEILFLDESTSNLDEETKKYIFNLLKNRKLTVINSTHDIESFNTIDHHYKIELENEHRVIKKMF